eukprot:scaffold4.g4756.t1
MPPVARSCALLLGLAALLGPARAGRALLTPAAEGADEGWSDGRATWFEHPHTGSCGYGKLDAYAFGADAVAALPDTFLPDYNTSCGRCYELRCRGIFAVAADGSERWDRSDACHPNATQQSIVIKVVDTCPCKGNEKWCCGDMPHFDLSARAFARLAPQGKGIIGLRYRPVPCELGLLQAQEQGGGAPAHVASFDASAWDRMERDIELGADEKVFVGGDIGLGWKKALCLPGRKAMHSANISLFAAAKGVEFWAKGGDGGAAPALTFRLANLMRGSCRREFEMVGGQGCGRGRTAVPATHATNDTEGGYARYYFPVSDFECSGDIRPADINRLQASVGPSCEEGSVIDSITGMCAPCPKGTIAIDGTCTLCPKGTFAKSGGMAECTPCTNGTYAAAVGATSCAECPAGTFSGAPGAAECSACPEDTFAPGTGSEMCKPCAAGQGTGDMVGAVECVPCGVGTYTTATGTGCAAAPAGSYVDSTGTKVAIACPPGTYSSFPGATSCAKCPTGTSSVGGSTRCSLCRPGTYAPRAASSSCSVCDPDTYTSLPGATACTPCPKGYTAPTGATTCKPVQ